MLACIPDDLPGGLPSNCQANSKKFEHKATATLILSEGTIQNGQLATPVLPSFDVRASIWSAQPQTHHTTRMLFNISSKLC